MSQLDEIASNLDAALRRLEEAVDARLQTASPTDPEVEAALVQEVSQLRAERNHLHQENALLRQDAAGLAQRLSGALQRLDTIITRNDETDHIKEETQGEAAL